MKKEYKRVTGNSLSLTNVKDKEPKMLVQSTSRIHSWVEAQQDFTIGGIPEEPELGHTVEERLDDTFKKFLGMGKDKFPKTKKPENVSGNRDEEPPKKKKITEKIDKKTLDQALKTIQEELTIDGRKTYCCKRKIHYGFGSKRSETKRHFEICSKGKRKKRCSNKR